MNADDPWQCLATCMELHAALESGDPFSFASSLPIHQDGTCNGLQHYAALGGDDRGARQVNLSSGDRPSDVYSHVGAMVEKMLEEDKKAGNKFAIMLHGKITRKVVKQTVSLLLPWRRPVIDLIKSEGHDYCVWSDVRRCPRTDREAVEGS